MTGKRGQNQQLPITVSQYDDKNEYKRQYYKLKKNPKKNRADWLKWKYNFTEEEYKILLEKQNNSCAICLTTEIGCGHKHFHVDHDHLTEKVRGLLCHKCNKGLGLFKDNPDFLHRAINYLDMKKAPEKGPENDEL